MLFSWQKGKRLYQPNPMVGCVIVHNNTIIGQGWHQKAGAPHAEVNAIGVQKGTLKTATLCTLDPAVIMVGPRLVVAALFKKASPKWWWAV